MLERWKEKRDNKEEKWPNGRKKKKKDTAQCLAYNKCLVITEEEEEKDEEEKGGGERERVEQEERGRKAEKSLHLKAESLITISGLTTFWNIIERHSFSGLQTSLLHNLQTQLSR